MKKYFGNYKDFQKMTHDELLALVETMTPEEKEDLEMNYIADHGINFLGVKNYIAHKYFPRIFNTPGEKKPSFSERLEAIITGEPI